MTRAGFLPQHAEIPSRVCGAKPNVNRIYHIIPANQNKGYVLQSVISLEALNFYGRE